jgi:small conductance mechanosensitive channel
MDFLQNSEQYIQEYLIPWGINIAFAAIIFIVGRMVAKIITKMLGKGLERASVDKTLVQFLNNIVYVALLVFVIIAALDRLGVDTTSVMAIFAAAGLAVGLALKDSLANFSAGVMLVLFRPFKKGDYVEAGGTAGVIENITIFNTVMITPDNREVIVPNGLIYGGTIVNVTARDTRRIDLIFGIGYDDNIGKAKELIETAMGQDTRILKDPAPAVMVAELADSSVNLAARPWVNTGDYWAVRADLLENIKLSFDANGISIPFPQRDMHVYQVEPSGASDDKAAA